MNEDQRTDKPVVARKGPAAVHVKPGIVYKWCRCGFAETQPFCDNTHREKSTLKSLKLEFEEEQVVLFCQCKQTKTPPFCDDTHLTLE